MRLAIALALWVLAVNGNATIIKKDWSEAGDRLVSYDTRTSLQWLAPELFLGTSWNDMQSRLQHDSTLKGYRYATSDEWFDIIGPQGLNIHPSDTVNETGSSRRLSNLLSLDQGKFPLYMWLVYGTPEYSRAPSDDMGFGDAYGYNVCTSNTHVELTGVYFADSCLMEWFSPTINGNFGPEWMTHVLVREVPEPTTLGLFGLGLMGLAANRRRYSR